MMTIKQQRDHIRINSYYTDGQDLLLILNVNKITLKAEDAITGEISTHGIGGFRRNWWLVSDKNIEMV